MATPASRFLQSPLVRLGANALFPGVGGLFAQGAGQVLGGDPITGLFNVASSLTPQPEEDPRLQQLFQNVAQQELERIRRAPSTALPQQQAEDPFGFGFPDTGIASLL